MRSIKGTLLFAATVTIATLSFGTLRAEELITDFSGKDPSVEDIVNALRPAMKTRGIKPGAAVGATKVAGSGAISFDQITFQFNSADLTPEAQKTLDKIGKALSDERLAEQNFKVEGHTDARGNAAYNLALSKRRAESAKQYLVSNYEIESSRLQIAGKGFTELLYKDEPESPKNRRVVIRTVKEN